ncbi:hypothetical protein HPB48_002180 [Haemaphysalis longicornis]|uniref:Secreted protein n=1 Tax=Haemaphysalis longicornis TaxID=44386 RepID=A0A9J6FGI0_HAELO|nr:hypothetical protein HPB48_002180 [Haemaphysalis longicornis]
MSNHCVFLMQILLLGTSRTASDFSPPYFIATEHGDDCARDVPPHVEFNWTPPPTTSTNIKTQLHSYKGACGKNPFAELAGFAMSMLMVSDDDSVDEDLDVFFVDL